MQIENHIFHSASFAELIDAAVGFMCNTPMVTLPPDEKFSGGGVYALYYQGNFPQYQAIFAVDPNLPIYVGKAVFPGWRKGKGSAKQNDPALYSRLSEYARSLKAAVNLELSDFLCRFIILQSQEADLISTVEAAMTRKYRPLWNSYIDGFGNHDPRKGRYQQAKSEWDMLHPGRVWAERLRGVPPDVNQIAEKVDHYHAPRQT